MSDLEKLQKFYRVSNENTWAQILAQPEIQVFSHGDLAAAVSVVNVDMAVTNNEESQPYISFDDVIDYEHLDQLKGLIEVFPQFRWEEKALPKLMFDLTAHDYEYYRSLVKTRNSYTKGIKYQQIKHTISDVTEEKLIEIVDRKSKSYPDFKLDYVKFNQEYDNAKWVLISGSVNGEFLYEMLCTVCPKRVYGVLVNVTENLELKSSHTPYIVAHLETLKLGYSLNSPLVDFGLFFPYKAVFGVEPVWYPGLRWA
jgi:hypothetical protein